MKIHIYRRMDITRQIILGEPLPEEAPPFYGCCQDEIGFYVDIQTLDDLLKIVEQEDKLEISQKPNHDGFVITLYAEYEK